MPCIVNVTDLGSRIPTIIAKAVRDRSPISITRLVKKFQNLIRDASLKVLRYSGYHTQASWIRP